MDVSLKMRYASMEKFYLCKAKHILFMSWTKYRFSLILLFSIVYFLFVGCSDNSLIINKEEANPIDLVDPEIGTISYYGKETRPLVHLPHAMLRVSPCKEFVGDIYVQGLPLAQAGSTPKTSILFSPQRNDDSLKFVDRFLYDNENITPYSYELKLDMMNIDVAFSLTEHCGIYRLRNHPKDPLIQKFCFVSDSSNTSISLSSEGNIQIQYPLQGKGYMYLLLKSNIPFKMDSIRNKTSKNDLFIAFLQKGSHNVTIKYAISLISFEEAANNLRNEIPDYEYNIIQKRARNTWETFLNRVTINGGSLSQKKVFYTALYRTLSVPICISEYGKYYCAFTDSIHLDNGTPFYTNDFFAETYATLHPLKALIYPEIEKAAIDSYIKMSQWTHDQTFPAYPSYGGDIAQNNTPHRAHMAIAAAYSRDITDIDIQKVFEASKRFIEKYPCDKYDSIVYNYIARRSGHPQEQRLFTDSINYNDLPIEKLSQLLAPYNINTIASKIKSQNLEQAIDIRIEKIRSNPPNLSDFYSYYLYGYTSSQEKGARYLQSIIRYNFRDDLNGMPPSKSTAAMASNIVFTMLGLYPYAVEEGNYIVGTACFSDILIDRNGTSQIKIEVKNYHKNRNYIKRIEIGNHTIKGYVIPHNKLINGNTITFRCNDYFEIKK